MKRNPSGRGVQRYIARVEYFKRDALSDLKSGNLEGAAAFVKRCLALHDALNSEHWTVRKKLQAVVMAARQQVMDAARTHALNPKIRRALRNPLTATESEQLARSISEMTNAAALGKRAARGGVNPGVDARRYNDAAKIVNYLAGAKVLNVLDTDLLSGPAMWAKTVMDQRARIGINRVRKNSPGRVRYNLHSKREREVLETDVAVMKGAFRAAKSAGRVEQMRQIVGWFEGVAAAAEASKAPASYSKRLRSIARVLDRHIPEHPHRRAGGGGGSGESWLNRRRARTALRNSRAHRNPMKWLTKADLANLPALYSQENVKDPIAWVKFFTPWGSASWFITEYDPQDRLFFGLYKDVNGEELGYVSEAELRSIRGQFGLGVERDLHFRPTPLSKIRSGAVSNRRGRRRMMRRAPPVCNNPRHRHSRVRRNISFPEPTPPGSGGIVLSGPEQVAAGRMIALKGALRLELVGLKRRGRSAFSIVKEEFGLKGSKQAVFDQFVKMVEDVIAHRKKPPGFNPRARRNARYKHGQRVRMTRRQRIARRKMVSEVFARRAKVRARRNHAGLSGLMNAAEAKRAMRFS